MDVYQREIARDRTPKDSDPTMQNTYRGECLLIIP